MFGRLNETARGQLDVSLDKLTDIILLARTFDAESSKHDSKDEAANGEPSDKSVEDAAARDLRNAIEGLSEDEQAVLIALSWIGRGDFGPHEFDQALIMAFDRRRGSTADYLIGTPMLGEFLVQGAAACGAELGDIRSGQTPRPNGAAH